MNVTAELFDGALPVDGASMEDYLVELAVQEAKKRPNLPLQEEFHGGILRGLEIFLTPRKTTV